MTAAEPYDLVIIGSGPGGYVAAVRAAQLGLKTVCIEKSPRLGGVCLNVGCIPSKALLDSSEYYHLAKDHFAEHGIKTGRLSLDLPALMQRKDKVVSDLTDSVRSLLKGNKVEIIQGQASLLGNQQVKVVADEAKAAQSWASLYFWRPAASLWKSRACLLMVNGSSVPPKP